MNLLLILSVWIHIVAAIVWIGGMLTLVTVIIPITRQPEMVGVGARFLSPIALRFRRIAWWSLLGLVLTGTLNTLLRGIGPVDVLTLDILETAYGRAWAVKVALVGAALLLSYIHDFRVGPRLSVLQRQGPPSEEARVLRRRVLLLARANAILAMAIVLLAVALPRGGLF